MKMFVGVMLDVKNILIGINVKERITSQQLEG